MIVSPKQQVRIVSKENMVYDIIVIGAGPAGLSAAKTCLNINSSLKIAIIDKSKLLNTLICCGEGVYEIPFKSGITPKPGWIRYTVPYLGLNSPCGHRIEYLENVNTGLIIDRATMQNDVLEECKSLGVKTFLGKRVNKISSPNNNFQRNVTLANGDRLTGRVIIDASGPINDIKYDDKVIPTGIDNEVGYLAHLKVDNIRTNLINMHIGRSVAPGGYAWAFPRSNDEINVGIVLGKPFIKTYNIKSLLDTFIKTYYPDSTPIAFTAGVIPCYCNKSVLTLPGVLRCGDSAHLVNPLRRTGISEALISGKYAGESAVQICKISESNFEYKILKDYSEFINIKFCNQFESLHKVKKTLNNVPDEKFDAAANRLQNIPIKKLTMAKIFQEAVSQYPKLLFALRHFL